MLHSQVIIHYLIIIFKEQCLMDLIYQVKIISKSSLWDASVKNTNLENANFSFSRFQGGLILTKIKNKSLTGSNLFKTSFLLANLSGVNLSNVILDGTNFLQDKSLRSRFHNHIQRTLSHGSVFRAS